MILVINHNWWHEVFELLVGSFWCLMYLFNISKTEKWTIPWDKFKINFRFGISTKEKLDAPVCHSEIILSSLLCQFGFLKTWICMTRFRMFCFSYMTSIQLIRSQSIWSTACWWSGFWSLISTCIVISFSGSTDAC